MAGLDEREVDRDPLRQVGAWLKEAAEPRGLQSMALATATADGRPSVRMVLLKGFDERGFVFYSGYDSRKGEELEENPRAALLFHWPALGRQLRAEGRVERVPAEESDAYWRTRPLRSRLSATASPQSRVVASRGELEALVAEVATAGEPPRPDRWGGYRVVPDAYELWQHREDRLHDRLRYRRDGDAWVLERLAP